MFREDYILRIIRELVEALIYLTRLRKGRQLEQARESSEQLFKRLLDMGVAETDQLSAGQLIAMLKIQAGESFWRQKGLLLAAALREQGQIDLAGGDEQPFVERTTKALNLVLAIRGEDPALEPPSYAPPVEELVADLAEFHLPPETNAALLQHYELIGAYHQAEDLLFDWLANEPERAGEIAALGVALYQRLGTQPDEALERVGLTREEIKESAAELQEMLVHHEGNAEDPR